MGLKKINFRDILQIFQTILLILLVVQVYMMQTGNQDNARKKQMRQPRVPVKIDADMNELTKGSYYLGNKDAKLKIIKYNSFSCGYCKKARDPLMKIAKEYSDDVHVVYKHFNRGNIDANPSQAAECAGEQGKFWDMYNAIFDKGARGDFGAYAKAIGVNVPKFRKCMSSGKYKGKTEMDTSAGRKLGIRATPSFIINNKLVRGYKPYAAFEKIVKEELKKL